MRHRSMTTSLGIAGDRFREKLIKFDTEQRYRLVMFCAVATMAVRFPATEESGSATDSQERATLKKAQVTA